jgi:radical SAM superfamily enzyme YgiQ (UPF0313 family)
MSSAAVKLGIADPRLAALRNRVAPYDFHEGAVLINVPLVPLDLVDRDVALNRGYFAYPPTTQLYLSAILREHNVPSIVLDLNFVLLEEARRPDPDLEGAWKRALDGALSRFENPLICVSLMFESTYDQFKRICDYVRRSKPSSCIMSGGVAATADPEKLVTEGMTDLVFLHEGEKPLADFYGFLDGSSNRSPSNLVFLDRSGTVVRMDSAEGGPIATDIRQDYEKIDVAKYCEVGSLSSLSRMQGIDVPYATILSRRGCRARCSFCGVRNFNGIGVRVRSPVDVVDEMQHLRDHYGVKHFDWLDDDLLYDRHSALELFGEIAKRLPDITWVANNGLIAAAIKAEILQAMQAAGCIGYKIGLESGNANVLRAVHKPTNLKKFFEFSKLAKDFPRMFVSVNFIMGFPGETIQQMRDSFVTSVTAGLDWNSFYVYQHLKNTELYLTYGSVSGSVLETDYSKDGQTPKVFLKDINPVRGAAFQDMSLDTGWARNYDVFDLPPDLVPSRGQLNEVWFTYSLVSNYLFNPALRTDSEVRLANGIKWLRAVQQAYPRDAIMAASLYYLEVRMGTLPTTEIESLRVAAADKLERSVYWQDRDRAFGFSAFLDRALPTVDPRCLSFLG